MLFPLILSPETSSSQRHLRIDRGTLKKRMQHSQAIRQDLTGNFSNFLYNFPCRKQFFIFILLQPITKNDTLTRERYT